MNWGNRTIPLLVPISFSAHLPSFAFRGKLRLEVTQFLRNPGSQFLFLGNRDISKQTGMDPIERLRFLALSPSLAPVPGARKCYLSIGSLPTALIVLHLSWCWKQWMINFPEENIRTRVASKGQTIKQGNASPRTRKKLDASHATYHMPLPPTLWVSVRK